MDRLYIKRVDANTGIVMRINNDMSNKCMTEELPYKECKAYLLLHQESGRIYKVASISKRKNARRKFVARLLCKDDDAALVYFSYKFTTEQYPDCTLQLVTGDWKILAQRNSEGLITII